MLEEGEEDGGEGKVRLDLPIKHLALSIIMLDQSEIETVYPQVDC